MTLSTEVPPAEQQGLDVSPDVAEGRALRSPTELLETLFSESAPEKVPDLFCSNGSFTVHKCLSDSCDQLASLDRWNWKHTGDKSHYYYRALSRTGKLIAIRARRDSKRDSLGDYYIELQPISNNNTLTRHVSEKDVFIIRRKNFIHSVNHRYRRTVITLEPANSDQEVPDRKVIEYIWTCRPNPDSLFDNPKPEPELQNSDIEDDEDSDIEEKILTTKRQRKVVKLEDFTDVDDVVGSDSDGKGGRLSEDCDDDDDEYRAESESEASGDSEISSDPDSLDVPNSASTSSVLDTSIPGVAIKGEPEVSQTEHMASGKGEIQTSKARKRPRPSTKRKDTRNGITGGISGSKVQKAGAKVKDAVSQPVNKKTRAKAVRKRRSFATQTQQCKLEPLDEPLAPTPRLPPIVENAPGEITKLFVSNLSPGVTDDDLADLFCDFGTLKHYVIHYNAHGKRQGTGEVHFGSRQAALNAILQYNNVPLDGLPLRIAMIGGGYGSL